MGFQKQRIRGDAFMRLLGWELRHLRGRRPGAWWLLWAPVSLAIPVVAWWIAAQPERELGPGWIVHNAALGLLVLTPLHDEIARLGQMTFGFRLLRFATDLVVAFTRLALPAVAAAGVVRDRHSGRLAELQLTGLSSFQICSNRCKEAASVLPASLSQAAACLCTSFASGANASLNIRQMSSSELLTMRRVCLSQSTSQRIASGP